MMLMRTKDLMLMKKAERKKNIMTVTRMKTGLMILNMKEKTLRL